MGRHAIITGASAGLGAALARELATRGFSVGLIARRAEALQAVAESIRATGGEAAAAAADVADFDALRAAIQELEQALGPCDLLIANAGISPLLTTWKTEPGALLQTMRVNLDGAVHAALAVAPGMVERGDGHLVAISSIGATRAVPGYTIYAASKAALSTFWEGLGMELAGTGVTCTRVHPGYIATEMTAGNDFYMPMLMSADSAARRIADAAMAKRSRLDLPWQVAWANRLAALLPDRTYAWLVKRFLPPL